MKIDKPGYKQSEYTYVKYKPKKQGRNEPCNCGSGKKYKKCCINKEGEVR